MEQLNLTTDWDKVFPRSDKVDHSKVTFHNRYGITLAADLYIPKGASGQTACHCGMRTVRRGQGAVVGSVCPDHGGVWLPDPGL